MGKEVERLEHHAYLSANGVDVAHIIGHLDPINDDIAALMLLQAVDGADNVDLPEPEGPITTTTSLRRTEVVTPRRAWKSPNHLCTSRATMMLSASGACSDATAASAATFTSECFRAPSQPLRGTHPLNHYALPLANAKMPFHPTTDK